MRYRHRLVRARADLVEGYGGAQVRDWASARRDAFSGTLQPLSSDEDASSRTTTTTRWRLFSVVMPGGLLATDRVESADGDLVLDVDGDVEHWGAGTSREHLEVVLVKATDL